MSSLPEEAQSPEKPNVIPSRGSDVIHEHPIVSGRSRAHLGKRGVIEHARNGVARFNHDDTNGAGFEVVAIVAGSKRSDRGARDWRQRTIEGAHNRAHADFVGGASQCISSAFALLGIDETRVSQRGQDMIEKLFRNRIGLSDVRYLRQLARFKSRQVDHGFQAVLSLFREQTLILMRGPRAFDAPNPSYALPLSPANAL